jgi:hypothetical protein
MRRAVAIDEASFGPDHPDVARDKSSQPQRKSHSPGDPLGQRQAVLPYQIPARSEPDRTGLRQVEIPVAQRTLEAVIAAIGQPLGTYTTQECAAYFNRSFAAGKSLAKIVFESRPQTSIAAASLRQQRVRLVKIYGAARWMKISLAKKAAAFFKISRSAVAGAATDECSDFLSFDAITSKSL